MDGQEYLNQISSDARPIKANNKSGIWHSKFFIVGAVGLIALVLIIILGLILSGSKGNMKDKNIALLLHLDATAEIIKEYQSSVKSSELRSDSASLYGVLTNTSRSLETYLTENQNFKSKDIPKEVSSEAETAKETLSDELFVAKINGLLDRTFAHKMTYEISLIMNEEVSILKSTKNEMLTKLLNESYGSLETLYEKFNGFSEGK